MSELITSLQNARIKQVIRLRDAQRRRESGTLLIDGAREIRQAIEGPISLIEIFVDSQCESVFDAIDLPPRSLPTATVAKLRALTTFVTTPVIEKLSFGNRNERAVAVAQQPSLELSSLALRDPTVVLVIDQVEKPGNIGAMVRTADAIGASAVMLSDPVCEVWNPNAIRASLGSIFRMPIVSGTASETIQWLADREFQIVAALTDGAVDYRPFQWRRPTAIVVGSEANGLGNAWNSTEIVGMKLPMFGTVDSLNVSVTAAILMYEAAFGIRSS